MVYTQKTKKFFSEHIPNPKTPTSTKIKKDLQIGATYPLIVGVLIIQ